MLRIGNSFGIDLSSHRSARVTRDSLANADLVIVMDLENLDRLGREFPDMTERTTLLGLFGTPARLSIADPYLAEEAATGRICEQVRAGVEGLAEWITKVKSAAYTPALPSTAAGSH